MGEYFKDREEDRKKEKKVELIDDWGKLIATYAFENERYQYTIDEDYKNILPPRTNLLGDNTPNNPGWIKEIINYLNTSKIGDMSVGGTMKNIVREIKYLADMDESHMDHLETHAEHYQFICESSIQMMEQLYKELDGLKAKIIRLEGEEVKIEEEIGPPLTEERKEELKIMYKNCVTITDFGRMVNPKVGGQYLNKSEIAYLREFNAKYQKFKGHRLGYGHLEKDRASIEKPKDEIDESKETAEELPDKTSSQNEETKEIIKNQPESQVYSPLSQRPPKKEPLYSDSSENPE